jgi:pilus assembly protein CpaF
MFINLVKKLQDQKQSHNWNQRDNQKQSHKYNQRNNEKQSYILNREHNHQEYQNCQKIHEIHETHEDHRSHSTYDAQNIHNTHEIHTTHETHSTQNSHEVEENPQSQQDQRSEQFLKEEETQKFQFNTFIEAVQEIERRIQNDSRKALTFQNSPEKSRYEFILEQISLVSENLDPFLQNRIRQEFLSWGPVESLIEESTVTEIMINEYDQIWVEKKGVVYPHSDHFATGLSFQNFLNRLLSEVKKVINVENPLVEGVFKQFRVQIIGSELTTKGPKICLRRQALNPWTLESLYEEGWCDLQALNVLEGLIHKKKNFIVVGSTGSGKTSVLGALSQKLNLNERVVYIEDTSELKLSNPVSLKLLTRYDSSGLCRNFSQSDLLKSALRLRPDRIVMGEIRGEEAKDFLMALSTGHEGSFGSLHAQSPSQALLRLEMLVQLGAPFWSLSAIRRLLQISLHFIIVVGRENLGKRVLQGIYKIGSLEENGFTIETCYQRTPTRDFLPEGNSQR